MTGNGVTVLRSIIHAPHLTAIPLPYATDVPPPPPPPIPPPRELPSEPTVAELAENFAGAMARWAEAGFPIVSKEAYAARSAQCDSCDYWDGAARLGLGKCTAPGCGCTKLKRWLASEQCKHPEGSRWPK